ncbi:MULTISPECIES: hypothetical protein [Micrococcaceae]|uniref:hypothetical protein n=1 Tax=unclassified Kocuria TaxID=2649579 RepID=UPI0013EC58FD|nr:MULTISPECIES: hypothetical protein [unclassified Kocuria]
MIEPARTGAIVPVEIGVGAQTLGGGRQKIELEKELSVAASMRQKGLARALARGCSFW